MKTKAFGWLFGAIFTIVGAVFVIGGIFRIVSNIEFKNRAIEHTAVISNITTHRDSDGDNDYTVYVKYYIEDQAYEES
ncbi:MAG: hypothetical protein Q8880_11495, partial [Bacteroidota bacterium]|nr:hypothetical protein [Bacteroidota bacterium]